MGLGSDKVNPLASSSRWPVVDDTASASATFEAAEEEGVVGGFTEEEGC